MRMLNKNKQTMYYSIPTGRTIPVYERDENGQIKYISIDGAMVPVESGRTEPEYTIPQKFSNGISAQLSRAVVKAFGIDDSSTYAQMDCAANEFSFGKGTYIWRKSKVEYIDHEEKNVDVSTADYIVENVLDEGLNVWNYLLKRILK